MADTAEELAERHAASVRGDRHHIRLWELEQRCDRLEAALWQKKIEVRELGHKVRNINDRNISMLFVLAKVVKFAVESELTLTGHKFTAAQRKILAEVDRLENEDVVGETQAP